ncbi:MAG: hypothetical protein M1536_05065 [Firmicutes bacterium]|nr:hypothetical protein [Bacillota bacterium]
MFFSAYFFTLSSNMEGGDFLQMTLEVEDITHLHFRSMAHIAWIPLGKLVYGFASFIGYGGGSIKPVEILNIFLAALGSAIFLILIYELTKSLLVSICLTAFLSFSYALWFEFVHTELYSGSFLFVILSFYLYSKENIKFKTLFIALANSFALFFHLTNLGIVLCSVIYYLSGKEKIKEKIKNSSVFILFLTLILLIGYGLSEMTTSLGYVRAFGQGTTWMLLFQYHLATSFFRGIFINGLVWYIIYLSLFIFLFIASFKDIFKSRLLYLSLIFGFLLALTIKITAPLSPNFANILVVLSIALALMLRGYNRFSLLKKGTVALVLVFLAAFIFSKNFQLLYDSKDIGKDHIYQAAIAKPGNLISSSDIVFANGILPSYLEYYIRCKTYIIYPECNGEYLYQVLVNDINSCIYKDRVKLFLDRSEKEIVPAANILDIDYFLKRLSKDFRLELLYETKGGDPLYKDVVLYEVKKSKSEK